MKSIIALLFVCFSISANAQIQHDTTHVLVWYITNAQTGASTTGYAYRVNAFDYRFPNQLTPDQLKSDKVTLEKQKTIIEQNFYLNLSDTANSHIVTLQDFGATPENIKKIFRPLSTKYTDPALSKK